VAQQWVGELRSLRDDVAMIDGNDVAVRRAVAWLRPGDTVVAVVACALAAKACLEDEAVLANLAAGHVVGQVGTSTCSVERLIDLVRESE
jgi:hypothetical protein